MDGWTLHYQYCYLFRYIYPDEFASLDAAERSRFTNSVATYLASVHSMVDPGQPHFAALDGYLRNTDLITKAARVYAMQHKLVWQTLARDPSWNVAANPGLHAEEMVDLRPDSFAGEEGFLRIAGWIEFYVTMLQGLFARQEALLQEIDAAVRDLLGPSPHALPDPARRTMKVAWPPERGAATLRFNQFEREVMRRVSALERRLNVDQLRVLEPSPSISPRTLSGPTREARKADALRSIDQAAAVYRGSYATVITDRMGIPEAALKTPKSRRLAGLISQFKALTPIIYRDEKRLSFLLSIFEDAMLRAELDGPSPSAQVQF
jgi:hypothetical protein